ncbi:class I SAM-dependent methyltransferase [Pseudomonas syringae]|uniref:Chromosome segregation ATPase n=2 Tax=Pseudomonas syringae TaxID=317 RepID=A0A656JYC7_PSESF|nr:class I SAM-dependent methyltransferase [Pseudomonas syringae]EPN59927.1 chromosome segregation ATPase [Pseudomonas syringae pv. actinidiae ICMP 19096]EPM46279.1 chromosome segregation ATPase [Pseudomonas syringae pv. actinidiae ICMP 19098]EPM91068.1 chromosome segregation ATPase [Pseudomonas syringae pv. actinidiae ICMP 18804]EPN17609.1 chromosome segregation ATPase [Pseudomonas syringae pv. actinidiae ICMP 19100]EPN25257.1 chromosome segregation ATPase [Pseudomonas syringae pv. actinidiae
MTVPFYRAFEDRHRGSRELIRGRQQAYVPFIQPLQQLYPACNVLDLGCGRGEWLEILSQTGFSPLGIDLDSGMLEACIELGLPVEQNDALSALKKLPDESQALVSGFHIAEHIPFNDLKVLVAEAMRVLKPAGLLILETPNAENLVVGTQNFYLDPTHERPIPHLLLDFLIEYSGFSRSKLMRLHEPVLLSGEGPVELMDVLGGASPDYAIVAQKAASIEQLEHFDIAFATDYGLALGTLAKRYDDQAMNRLQQIEQRNQHLETLVEQVRLHSDQLEVVVHELGGRSDSNYAHLDTQVQENYAHMDAQLREVGLRADLAESRFHTVQLLQENTLGDVTRAEVRLDEAFSVIEQLQIRLEHLTQHTLTQRQVEQAQVQAHAQAHLDDINAQLNASLGNAHHWWLRATAYEQQLTEIHRSTSWRITAPLRFAARVSYWPFRTSRSTFSQVLRRSVPHARLWLARRPLIERPVLAILKCNPWLHSKLSNMHQATLNPAPETVASDLQHGVIDHAPLTQRGRTIENALREAIMKGQK